MPAADTASPIALKRDEGEAYWFLDILVIAKAMGEATGGRCAVLENVARQGHGPPLHVHSREDEWFYIIEGELTFWVGGKVIAAPAGSFVYGPRGVPHTFTVSSPTARFMVVAQPAGFERFMKRLAEPAKALTLPPPNHPMPDPAHLTAVAAEFGIEILGPPGIPA